MKRGLPKKLQPSWEARDSGIRLLDRYENLIGRVKADQTEMNSQKHKRNFAELGGENVRLSSQIYNGKSEIIMLKAEVKTLTPKNFEHELTTNSRIDTPAKRNKPLTAKD